MRANDVIVDAKLPRCTADVASSMLTPASGPECLELRRHFSDIVEVEHNGGHEPPTKNNGAAALEAVDSFLNRFL